MHPQAAEGMLQAEDTCHQRQETNTAAKADTAPAHSDSRPADIAAPAEPALTVNKAADKPLKAHPANMAKADTVPVRVNTGLAHPHIAAVHLDQTQTPHSERDQIDQAELPAAASEELADTYYQ